MAFRAAMLRSAGGNMWCSLGLRRSTHAIAQSAPLDNSINDPMTISPHLILAEFDLNSENRNIEFGFPSFSFGGGSMELMAVSKKKVFPHK